ncbi:hypothetical protein [Streptomyces abikoensis]|uniref:hypothetical protein n=1 Tax=Streptomyces abikoensis TaxID=97398 RepID=UPI0027E50FB6|nr:hypothetical protein [Streptomyces abikoensis]
MGETAVIRGLAVAAAAATVVGSVMMRRWDRAAGRRVAQLTAARTREEWKTEERVAELETDLEETRLARAGLETKLRAKRAELARLRTEHADLLRRYASAETGRASALEGRRLLEKTGKPTDKPAPLNAEAYRKAADALKKLGEAAPVVGNRPAGRDGWAQPAPRPAAAKAPQPAPAKAAQPAPAKAAQPAPVKAAAPAPAKAAAPPAKAAARPTGTVVPAARRKSGGFDFFGNAKKKAVEEQDLADVVGEEALADADGKVIDLTAHDDTEQIDVVELRGAIS